MGIQTGVLNGNNYIVTETISGLITSRLYNLLETTAYLTQESSGYQTCQLVTEEVPNIAVSDNPGSIYFGNSIFGSSVPSIVFAAAKVNCGSSVSSGGGSTATSTSGLQTTGNTSLASIDSKTPALGQALSTASSPVVLPASQVASLTPPTNTGYALDASVNSLLKPASTLAALTTLGTITNALPVGANTIGNVNQLITTAGFSRVTDGTNISAVKPPLIAPLAIDPALVVALSPNGGQATAANQATTNTTLATISTNTPPLGQALVTTSSPVVLPASQITSLTPPTNVGYALDTSVNSLLKPTSTLTAVTTLGTITNALPVGANTIGNVNQTIGVAGFGKITDGANTSAVKPASSAAIATDPALVVVLSPNGNQATSANQATTNTSLASIVTNTTGASTAANQTTTNTTLTSILGNTPPLGQALAAASSPVVLPATQITALTPPTNIGYALDTSVNSLLKPASTLAAVTTLGTITNALPVGANTIGNINQLITTAGFSKVTDGTNTGVVKPASTAPLVTDTALVVALSPNGNQSTATNQATTNASLASIDLKTPTLGQKLSVGSVPVVIASDNIVTVRTDQTTHGTTDKVAADLIQVAGVAITVGLGAATANSQRIAIANDSRIIPWDGTTPITVKPASINALTTETAAIVALRPLVTTQVGQINPPSDTPLTPGVRIRSILFTNTSGATIFLGVYNSVIAPLTSSSVPLNGYVIRVPAGATLDKGIADFSINGRFFGANLRIGLSSTLATYTALSAPILALTSLNLELN